MANLRPSDLAREHGLSAQAVRNYERAGFIPPAERTRSGYRVYTEVHAAALRAFLALVRAYGYRLSGEIMHAIADDDVDGAVVMIAHGHERLLQDRGTLDAVRAAVGRLTVAISAIPDGPARTAPYSIGELAHRLGVTSATLRNWEAAGILKPQRDPTTGYRRFGPDDVRDAELAHLLRRGGYLLDHVATVIQQVRIAGGTDTLSSALEDWQQKLTARGIAMLHASTRLSQYLSLLHHPRG
ncbi:TioE family transcriptional regulator [Phytoactinopolyspora limicola]|uniref:TioE family transcriptional regulator n=1 Tax=Phytoactinopolyspora limicola TaxID=2715536 RepID=UPI001407F63C|nr:TioE family transcriptional regulator [Phytoactinopolyspora limicola]